MGKAYWSERRETFAQLIASGLSAAEAGKRVGYSAANARRNAQRADVKKRVAELTAPAKAAIQEQITITRQWATERHLEVVRRASLDDAGPADYHRALDAIAKLYGLYAPEKHEHEVHGLGDRINRALARGRADRTRRADTGGPA